MAPAEILLTTAAAQATRGLAPLAKAAVAKFLREDLERYATTHEPQQIRGLEGKYWVVQPAAGEERLALVVTQRASQNDRPPVFVVTAVVPETGEVQRSRGKSDSADIALGAELLRSAEPVD